MEKMGAQFSGLMAGNGYEKNAKADGFDVEVIVEKFDVAKMWSSPGHALGGGSGGGGDAPLSAQEMRLKRLEAIERQDRGRKEAEERKAKGE